MSVEELPKCNIAGCAYTARAFSGRCPLHDPGPVSGGRIALAETVSPYPAPRPRVDKVKCLTETCDRVGDASRGYCGGCYQRLRRNMAECAECEKKTLDPIVDGEGDKLCPRCFTELNTRAVRRPRAVCA